MRLLGALPGAALSVSAERDILEGFPAIWGGDAFPFSLPHPRIYDV
jgi:hypothetical protein